MKYLSTFSGVGGFELGIQQAYENNANRKTQFVQESGRGGIQYERVSPNTQDKYAGDKMPTCIGYSEIDRYATKVYQHHFPTHHAYGDITAINEKTLPDFDLLVGGFPCQSFSIAGKRQGFYDTRGTLFFDIARIVREKQPRLLLLENVKGLLSHDQGSTFYTIISTLDELGYDLQWQVLNAKDFGVPQNRERVFIIGHLRGTPRPQVFPFGETNSNDIIQINQPKHSNDRVYREDGISPTLNTMQGGRRQPFVLNQQTRNADRPSLKYSSGGSGLLVKEDEAFCLPAGGGSGQYLLGAKIRRLTPTECERLMGLPDNWTNVEGMSDSQRYKQCGNGVVVNVVQAIVEKLL